MYIFMGFVPFEGCEVETDLPIGVATSEALRKSPYRVPDVKALSFNMKYPSYVKVIKGYTYNGEYSAIRYDESINFKDYPFYMRLFDVAKSSFIDLTVNETVDFLNKNFMDVVFCAKIQGNLSLCVLKGDSPASAFGPLLYSDDYFLYRNDEQKFYIIGKPSKKDFSTGVIQYFIWKDMIYSPVESLDAFPFYLPSYDKDTYDTKVYLGKNCFWLETTRFKMDSSLEKYKGYTLFYDYDFSLSDTRPTFIGNKHRRCTFVRNIDGENDWDTDIMEQLHRNYSYSPTRMSDIQKDAMNIVLNTELADVLGGKRAVIKDLVSHNLFKE